jgi:hypothetical protein
MKKRIDLQEDTYLRLLAVLDELAHCKTRDMTIDDVINALIDIYQEKLDPFWGWSWGRLACTLT